MGEPGQHGTGPLGHTGGNQEGPSAPSPSRPHCGGRGRRLPGAQGLVLGCTGKKGQLTALVDSDDIHCLMIGASGVGKTAFFLYPNLEYACASGMSFFASDTKGDLPGTMGPSPGTAMATRWRWWIFGTPPAQMAITCSP